jgi:membrane protease YdiL (CAAX protease family)
MMTIKAFIERRPLPTYFALTFAISWGGVLLVIGGPGGIRGTTAQTDPLFPFVYLAMLAGPSVAGILLTGLVHGRAGLRRFLSRSLKWRVGARWYAVALLTAPLLMTATLFALSLTSPIFLPGIFTSPDKASLLLFGIAVGLGAGFFEELGWTGFAVPGVRLRYGGLATGLIVGGLWGAWHFLVVVWGIGSSAGALSLILFVPLDLFSFLPAYRVLMVWVYDRTGSLLVAMLMHASLTASMLIFGPLAISGVPLLTYELAFAAALWVVVAAVAVANRLQLSPQPLRRRVA